MTHGNATRYAMLLCGSLMMGAAPAHADSLTVSGGLDTRLEVETQDGHSEGGIDGAFLNARQVWSDDEGDRWIGVAQLDADDNFKEFSPYQLYLQYKGPLGKWNIRGGHFLLPFGLLATYDTERIPLGGLEPLSLGIRKDTGAEVLGHYGDIDYAISLTQGVGDERLFARDGTKLATARVAYVPSEDWQIGVSMLSGRVLRDSEFVITEPLQNQTRFALDTTYIEGPVTLRAEAVAGDNGAGGGVVLADYALSPDWEVNTRYAAWHEEDTDQFAGLGVTYRLGNGMLIRLADEMQFGKEHNNTIMAQLYVEFSNTY